jgi:hypothetical protein
LKPSCAYISAASPRIFWNYFIVINLIKHHHYQAQPGSGYADGLGTVARFSAPESVAFLDGGHVIVVADTGGNMYI